MTTLEIISANQATGKSWSDIFVAIATIWGLAILIALAQMVINYLKTVTKNERLKFVLELADQVVGVAEKLNKPGTVKKEKATKLLTKRLEENNIDKFFTADQIDQIIENAVTHLKDFDFERNIKQPERIEEHGKMD